MTKAIERVLRILFGTLVACAVIFCGVFAYYATSNLDIATMPLQFSLKPGGGLRSSAQQMERAGVLKHPKILLRKTLGPGPLPATNPARRAPP